MRQGPSWVRGAVSQSETAGLSLPQPAAGGSAGRHSGSAASGRAPLPGKFGSVPCRKRAGIASMRAADSRPYGVDDARCALSTAHKTIRPRCESPPWTRAAIQAAPTGALRVTQALRAAAPVQKRGRGGAVSSYVLSYSAFLAVSASRAKAAGSWMAISERVLRFISTPAFLRPYINRE